MHSFAAPVYHLIIHVEVFVEMTTHRQTIKSQNSVIKKNSESLVLVYYSVTPIEMVSHF